jgi:8-oxo-dGTP pyrophosphatase MutT (NUDIX family)
MSHPFSAAFRDEIAARCLEFPRQVYDGPALKHSAVVLLLVDADDGSGETSFLLTRRAPRLNAHAGQWALPGGRWDEGETLQQTALRELHEELGLQLDDAHVLGVLDDYPTRSGYVITPVVAWLDDPSAVAPNPQEVASVHRIRLDEIGRAEAVEFFSIPESDRPVIRLNFGKWRIHAPTAAVIYQLRELVAGRITRVADLEQPVFAWK